MIQSHVALNPIELPILSIEHAHNSSVMMTLNCSFRFLSNDYLQVSFYSDRYFHLYGITLLKLPIYS